jgi:polysaccharide deacetylase family protein (PEP-CTERM system associated)
LIDEVYAILSSLEKHSVEATFFVLAEVARRFPSLIAEIGAAGHEIACHGWSHDPVDRQTPKLFREETLRARDVLEDIAGQPVRGYRAAYFSIGPRCAWAWEVLEQAGFLYDSSTVRTGPFHAQPAAGPACARSLIRIPVTGVRWASCRIPLGGGYLHLLPYRTIAAAVRSQNEGSGCAILYFHPYDWPTRPLRLPATCSLLNGGLARIRFPHALGRRRARATVERLLREFPFGSIIDLCGDSPR